MQLTSCIIPLRDAPMMPANIRDYREADGPALNDVALAVFAQFKDQYSDWPSMAAGVSRISD